MMRSHGNHIVCKVRHNSENGGFTVLSPEKPEGDRGVGEVEVKKRRPCKRVELEFSKTAPVTQRGDVEEQHRPNTAQCRARKLIESAQLYEENLQSAAPCVLSVEAVETLRKDLLHLQIDEGTNTISLSRAEIEAIKNPETLEFLAARPGFSKYVTGTTEQWMPCNVFITSLDDEGRPSEASIDDDVITYSVTSSCPPTPLYTPVSQPSVPATLVHAPAPEPKPAKKCSFMKETASSTRRRRNLLQEKEDMLNEETEVIEEIIECIPEPNKKTTVKKDVALQLSQRRTLTETEEEQVEAILQDARYDTEDVKVIEGEGYTLNAEDQKAEIEIVAKLQELRPDLCINEMLQKEEDTPDVKYATVRESDRDALIQKAREESLALRAPKDYLSDQKQERQRRQELASVNERLSQHFEAKADEEVNIKMQLEYSNDEVSSRLSGDVLKKLLQDAAREQGAVLGSMEDDPPNASATEPTRRAYVDPHCINEGGAEMHPEHSTYDTMIEDEPVDPSLLFPNEMTRQASPTPASPSVSAAPSENLSPILASSQAAPPTPNTVISISRPGTADPERSLFLNGDWGQLLERRCDGMLERPASRLSQRANTSERTGPTPEPGRDACPTPPTHRIDRLVL